MKDFSERQGSSKVVIKTPIGKATHSTAFSLRLEKVQRRHWILEMKEPPEPEHTPRRMPTLPPRPPVHNKYISAQDTSALGSDRCSADCNGNDLT